jgi:hypothetical protein
MARPTAPPDLLQGTRDVDPPRAAGRPTHGFGLSLLMRQMSRDVLPVARRSL